MEAEKIDIGWPDPGSTHGLFANTLAATARDMEYHGCMGNVHRVQSSLLVNARNLVVENFLLTSDSPWLWMVDSDMIFDKGHPMKLWKVANEFGVNMVSGLAFMFKDKKPIPSVFYENDEGQTGVAEHYIPDTPTVVAATGLASVLIHREVLEEMQPARFTNYRWFDILQGPNEKGVASGEDIGFFLRARELGYKLMLEPDAQTWHIKEIYIGREDWERWMELNATS